MSDLSETEATDETRRAAEEAHAASAEAAEQTQAAVEEAVTTATDAVTETVEAASEQIEQAREDVVEAVEAAAEEAATSTDGADPAKDVDYIVERVLERLNDNHATSQAAEVGDDVVAAPEAVITTMEEAAHDTVAPVSSHWWYADRTFPFFRKRA